MFYLIGEQPVKENLAKLGEVAVQKFLKDKFDLEIKLDFNIYDEIVPQDIVEITVSKSNRKPKIGVGIKSSKPKNVALVLGSNEIEIPTRSSDVYIFCRPDLPDDHLLRIGVDEVIKSVRDKPHYPVYKDAIPRFSNMSSEIVGFCYKENLEKVTEIPGQVFDGSRYVKLSGDLKRSEKDWKELISKL